MGKVSGPLLDRIDIHIELPAVKYKELTDTKESESSITIRARVEKTRVIQRERFKSEGIFYNAQMSGKLIKKYCNLDKEAREFLRMAMTELGLTARAHDKVLKVARTIGDLADAENILREHISEAIQYRSLDRRW
jgi:magnesium chelatase family protein